LLLQNKQSSFILYILNKII
jgi:hypothetical protein